MRMYLVKNNGVFQQMFMGHKRRTNGSGNMTGVLWKFIKGENLAQWTNWRELGVTVSITYEM